MADGAPVGYELVRIALDVHPAKQGIAGLCDEEPTACGGQARDELPGDRCDVRGIDRREREPGSPSRVTDHHPAIDKFASQQ